MAIELKLALGNRDLEVEVVPPGRVALSEYGRWMITMSTEEANTLAAALMLAAKEAE